MKRIHIIAGPTASGKSARALEMAIAEKGVILNADATQCYADLQILSARPDEEDLAKAPHKLYGIWPGEKVASVDDWLQVLIAEVKACWEDGKLPIICGGTGFYLKALKEGLSPIPDIDPAIRDQLITEKETNGNAALHHKLQTVDPVAAANIPGGNSQRIIRALEVYHGTGKPISEWQSIPRKAPFPEAEFSEEVIELDRETLYARCDVRFEQMIAKGAIEEVEQLLEKNYSADAPVMKAVGVPELRSYLQDKLSLDEAIALAQQNTRRYAKRQLTWLRNQL
jgi:tRNA dimethylallyltransferase